MCSGREHSLGWLNWKLFREDLERLAWDSLREDLGSMRRNVNLTLSVLMRGLRLSPAWGLLNSSRGTEGRPVQREIHQDTG